MNTWRRGILTVITAIGLALFMVGGSACGKKSAPVPPEDVQPAKPSQK